MKRTGLWLSLWILAASAMPFAWGQAVKHTAGRVEFGVFGRGFLAADIVNNSDILDNFIYPTDGPAKTYLRNYSEIWIGTGQAPIASALDVNAQSQLTFGEFIQQTAADAPQELAAQFGRQTIRAIYRAAPSSTVLLPFDVVVEQTSYSWEDRNSPESNGIALKLTVTNQTDLVADNLYVALATNWDVDPQRLDLQPQRPSMDLAEWDPSRRASIIFQGTNTAAGVDPTHVATVLMQGTLHAHRLIAINVTPQVLNDAQRAQILATPVVNPTPIIERNYYSILAAGPFRLVGRQSQTAIFALVAGENHDAVLDNIDGVRAAVSRPEGVVSEVTDDGIVLRWTPPIRTDVVGYAVYRALEEGGQFDPIGPRIVDGVEFVDAEVKEGTTYYYQIRAVGPDERPFDAPSKTLAATTTPKPPTPTLLGVQIGGASDAPEVALSLSRPTDVSLTGMKLQLLRNETGTAPFTVIQEGAFAESLTDKEVGPGKTYYYAARLVSDVGRFGDLSAAVEVDIPISVSTPYPDLSKVIAAPNPVSRSKGQKLRFLNMPQRATIFIYNAAGERVARIDNIAGISSVEWTPDPGLASGVYLYQVLWAPEAISKDYQSAPRGAAIKQVSGKFALMD